jgi:hypothetical protein
MIDSVMDRAGPDHKGARSLRELTMTTAVDDGC